MVALCTLCGACQPLGTTASLGVPAGKDVWLTDDLAFVLPNGYHEVVSPNGRTFRQRGSDVSHYSTVHAETLLVGAPVPLDEAFSLLLSRLGEEEALDVLDVQLGFVGHELMLTYAVRLRFLDVTRQQWGALVGRPEGLVAMYLTAPLEHFEEAALDFAQTLQSVHSI